MLGFKTLSETLLDLRTEEYSERVERFRQNRLFVSDQKRFYRKLENPTPCSTSPKPNRADLAAFWRNIWSREVEHEEGPWIAAVQEACARIEPMNPIAISSENVADAVRRAPNWKSPGADGLHHYWLKGFSVCHATLARQYQEAIERKTLPNLFTTGITHLAPKSTNTADPTNYRPITCLTSIYKTLTSVLSCKISRHIDEFNILSVAQNGCRGGGRGTKELLIIDSVAGQLVKRNRRNFSAAWIDYKKAFDSVPHSWLLRVLELYKIDGAVRDFLEVCMGQWSTILCLQGERLTTGADDRIRIRRGIFQGDCLSPLWFCLSLNPLSTLLERSGTGFQFRRGGTKVSHLLYMDDLKLLAPNPARLMELLKITTEFSGSIRMQLGVDKCAVVHVDRGQVTQSAEISLELSNFKTLSEAESYRYLGMSQCIGVQEVDMKQAVCEVFFGRLTKVLRSYLSGANKVRAYNGWVMPTLLYTFGVLRWTQTELDALDRRVRTTMTYHRMHHPKSSVMRLYIPRKCGGRGLLSAKSMHNREVCSLRAYFETRRESAMHGDVVVCDKGLTPLSLAKEEWRRPVVLSTSDRETVWMEKELHGRFYKALHAPHVDVKASVQWLRFGDLFGETEGFVCAIQDQVVKTNNYRKHILKDGTPDFCRACRHPGESLRHVLSGCSALANTEYLHRHNQVAKILHQELALMYCFLEQRMPYYQYTPVPVLERDGVRLYWDLPIATDRTILANKPDIVVMDRAQSRVFLVDITIPHDENLVKAETEKKRKYLDLAHEIVDMWGVESTEIIPIVISANGLIPVSLAHHLRQLGICDGSLAARMQKAIIITTRLSRLPLNAATRVAIETANKLLPPYLDGSLGLDDTGSILFGAALAVHRFIGAKTREPGRTINKNSDVPAWKKRIERRISLARALIGRLQSFRSGNTRPRIVRSVRIAFNGLGVRLDQPDIAEKLTERIDGLKQRIAAWGRRIRRYSERVERFRQNRLFVSDQKRFYRKLENPTPCFTSPKPNTADLVAFWRNIWSREVEHEEGPWIAAIQEACAGIEPMNPIAISSENVADAVRRAPNWKSPGADGLHHYWLKGFSVCHATLARQYQEAIERRTLPNLFTTGITHLAPKSTNTADPTNYRPITCLTSIYKTLTSVLSCKISRHIDEFNILSVAQNGCRGGCRGTKELLLIDSVAGQLVKRNRRNFSAAWIDYKKAFDSVPHSWLLRVLELYKIDSAVRDFLEVCMGQWSTILCLQGERLTTGADDRIWIRRGIFQGDCLSPLWFCLSLNPLSTLLERSGTGFQFRRGGTKVSHLLYMDDLKLLAPNAARLMELMKITTEFSGSIRMQLGVDRCAVVHVDRGQVTQSAEISLELSNFKTLSEAESYRYLGMSQCIGVQEVDMKQAVCEVFFGRLTKVLRSYLSGANKVRAYNGWVMPTLLYTFGVLRWTQTELDALDRRVRTTMTHHRMHHPKSSVMRLYIPRKCGGRGLLSAKSMHNREVCSLRIYFETRRESAIHGDVVVCDKGLTPLSLAKEEWRRPVVLSTSDRETVWMEKELHGRFYKALHAPHVDVKASVQWLRFGDLFGETEGFVCAIQDQVVKTNNYRKHILKDGTPDFCRACRHPGESLRHVLSGCSALANTEYLHRHNQAAKILHQELALMYCLLEQRVPYYQYTPAPVLERDGVRLYWDRPITTDRTILANKPDIVVMDRAQSRVFLVDITIPHDENLVKAETDKKRKYLDLAHEIVDMWGVDSTEIIPIVISANGLIPVSLAHHLRQLGIRDGSLAARMQKAVLLDSARIVRRFLSLQP
ncbi:unnamed protein product [Euphydryas editha]|uniref:Reverse transcriptase domain-containing protein n=1 Tax=Euphydryas editha TaxID=104508 RepID=A0AAU9TBV3_EUPED|nr:unnamed protein product [Euphydryas editha]